MFNLVRGAFLTITMVPKSKNIGSGSKSGQSWDFFDFLDFWDPDFPNSFRKNRSPMAPQGKPLCGKESHMDPLHVRFSSQTVESIGFYQSSQTVESIGFYQSNSIFHENPVSLVRPSEASSSRFLCFHPASPQYN